MSYNFRHNGYNFALYLLGIELFRFIIYLVSCLLLGSVKYVFMRFVLRRTIENIS